MIHRLRECWKKLAGVDEMQGLVEIDEAFFGGRNKNRHTKGKKGYSGKTAVIGIIDRSTNKITAAPLPETTKIRMESYIKRHVHKDAKKYTDENRT